jgi:Icc protein
MSEKKRDELLNDHNHDGIDRRGFLKCMAWAGTGALCVMQGGVLKSYSLSRMSELGPKAAGELTFVQISDSHMGFNKAANPDVVGTLKAAGRGACTSSVRDANRPLIQESRRLSASNA